MCAVLALALLALVIGLSQPICEAFDLHADSVAALNHSEDPGVCCTSVDKGALAAAADEVLPYFEPWLPPVFTRAPALRPRASLGIASLAPEPPAVFRPYHARSARILL